jgi:predicted nucleotidyltransferase
LPVGADRLTLLARVVATLRAREIPFAVVGAAAMAVHGVTRATRDVDLLATERASLEPGTWASLAGQGVAVDVRAGDASDPLAGVVRFTLPGTSPVDVVVGRAAWQRDVIARATATIVDGVEVPVVRPADLILLKLYAGGPQDAWDVVQVIGLPPDAALVAEVDARAHALPDAARELWSRIRSGA